MAEIHEAAAAGVVTETKQKEGIKLPSNEIRERNNWRIHLLYLRHEYAECLKLIEAQLAECFGMCEYALYVKGLIKRQQAEIQESLRLFQACTFLNPKNVANLKQVGRSFFLLGRHKAALEMYTEADKLSPDDWEVWHNKGLCYMYMKEADKAAECFKRANAISKHDITYMQLGNLYTLQKDFKAAKEVFQEALEFSPENPEILTTLGLLCLRLGENYKAFDYFSTALTHDPKNPRTILAAGSIIQDHNEVDMALIKYRIAAVQIPNSAQLWNNVGMCFFSKQRYIAAAACLKRALYLAPFEWIISFNLGLVHLNSGQYASAFNYFSAVVNLRPEYASTYMYLAITLSRLDDFENTCAAFEKAIELEQDHLFELNYAIILYKKGRLEQAKQHFISFEKLFQALDEEAQSTDPDVLEQRQLLSAALMVGKQ